MTDIPDRAHCAHLGFDCSSGSTYDALEGFVLLTSAKIEIKAHSYANVPAESRSGAVTHLREKWCWGRHGKRDKHIRKESYDRFKVGNCRTSGRASASVDRFRPPSNNQICYPGLLYALRSTCIGSLRRHQALPDDHCCALLAFAPTFMLRFCASD